MLSSWCRKASGGKQDPVLFRTFRRWWLFLFQTYHLPSGSVGESGYQELDWNFLWVDYSISIPSQCECTQFRTPPPPPHGLINYKDTKTKCRLYWCLIEFIVWRNSESCWYFRPSFVNYCPANLLSGSPPPPIPLSQSQSTIYCTQTVCGFEGIGGCWVVLEAIFCRSLTVCFWPDSEATKFLDHPKQKPRRGGGVQTDKHLPQSPFTGQFF